MRHVCIRWDVAVARVSSEVRIIDEEKPTRSFRMALLRAFSRIHAAMDRGRTRQESSPASAFHARRTWDILPSKSAAAS